MAKEGNRAVISSRIRDMSQIIAGARKALRHSDHGDSPQTGLSETSLFRDAMSAERAENRTLAEAAGLVADSASEPESWCLLAWRKLTVAAKIKARRIGC